MYIDPIPIDPIIRATDLEKYSHVFSIGDRVRVLETGHIGTIINEKFGKWYVQLDSDKKHVIHASESELVPENFPSASENAAPTGGNKMYRAYDPIPILGRENEFEPTPGAVGTLLKALQPLVEAGTVPVADFVAIKMAAEKIATGQYFVGPFGELESDGPFHTLQIFMEKYESGDDGALTKRAEASEESGRGDDPVPAIIKTLKSGGEVTLPSRLQHTCMKHEIMRKLISAGKIHFQETAFI